MRVPRQTRVSVSIDLIHDGRHIGFAILMQISYTLLGGANNTSSRGYNEQISHTDDFFRVQ